MPVPEKQIRVATTQLRILIKQAISSILYAAFLTTNFSKRTESLLELKEILAGSIAFCDPQFNVARWVAVIHNSGSYFREIYGRDHRR